MSKRSDLVPMGDMLDVALRISAKVAHLTRAQFDADENLRVTVMHFVQTVGEAARRVSEESRKAHPEIDWKDMIGMRSRLVHDYTNIDFDAVWKAATVDIPLLIDQLEAFMPTDPP